MYISLKVFGCLNHLLLQFSISVRSGGILHAFGLTQALASVQYVHVILFLKEVLRFQSKIVEIFSYI